MGLRNDRVSLCRGLLRIGLRRRRSPQSLWVMRVLVGQAGYFSCLSPPLSLTLFQRLLVGCCATFLSWYGKFLVMFCFLCFASCFPYLCSGYVMSTVETVGSRFINFPFPLLAICPGDSSEISDFPLLRTASVTYQVTHSALLSII